MSPVYQNKTNLAYWAALATIMEPEQLRKINTVAPNGQEALALNEATLVRLGFRPATAARIVIERKNLNPEKIINHLTDQNITLLHKNDDEYPALLKQISDAPLLLYLKGTLPPHSAPSLAIVGTRDPSFYGRQAALTLTRQLARAGLVIVSGLALGIDAIVHDACIEAGGKTIGVLGGGVDDKNIQPRSNALLAKRLLKTGGALISEYPPGTTGMVHHFPERNRIIAGLTRGTLVVEGHYKSGALITAACALEYNREVLTIPGRVGDRTAEGPLQLLVNGAHMVRSVDDVFTALNLAVSKIEKHQPTLPKLTPEESQLFALISQKMLTVDELVEQLQRPAQEVLATLTALELKGVIRDTGGQRYAPNI